jgi:DNA-binding transcriptional ArsR family regulator
MALVAEILRKETLQYDEVFFNVSSGSKMLSCAGLSAAFVNGIKAIGATESGLFHLPVLKFSYSELISEPKVKILQALRDSGGSVESLAVLEERAKVEKSLLSYHIRGGRESKGLADLGLVEVDRGEYGKLAVRLTELGRLVLVGR